MRTFTSRTLAVLLFTASIFGSNALTLPSGVSSLMPRAGAEGLRKIGFGWVQILIAVQDFLKDKNAYDPDIPDKCVLHIGTTSGGHCSGKVDCGEISGGRVLPPWNVCYLGGRQYFTDPHLGDFSITYTKAGGVDGNTEDGLHHPVIQVAGISDWQELNVEDIIDANHGADSGNICYKKKGVSEDIGYHCAIPVLDTSVKSVFGLANIPADSSESGFTPGWCTAHVIQYQKNEFGNGPNFAFVAQLFDGAGKQIGHLDKTAVDDKGGLAMTSRLPYTITFQVGAFDQDPVTFCYAGECWTCDDGDGGAHACTLGNGKENGYENGDREGDFGFTC